MLWLVPLKSVLCNLKYNFHFKLKYLWFNAMEDLSININYELCQFSQDSTFQSPFSLRIHLMVNLSPAQSASCRACLLLSLQKSYSVCVLKSLSPVKLVSCSICLLPSLSSAEFVSFRVGLLQRLPSAQLASCRVFFPPYRFYPLCRLSLTQSVSNRVCLLLSLSSVEQLSFSTCLISACVLPSSSLDMSVSCRAFLLLSLLLLSFSPAQTVFSRVCLLQNFFLLSLSPTVYSLSPEESVFCVASHMRDLILPLCLPQTVLSSYQFVSFFQLAPSYCLSPSLSLV